MKYSDLVNGLQPLEHKYNGHGKNNLIEFENLKEFLDQTKKQNFWFGHGNYDVYEQFLKLVKYLGLTDWFFTSNLSRRPVF